MYLTLARWSLTLGINSASLVPGFNVTYILNFGKITALETLKKERTDRAKSATSFNMIISTHCNVITEPNCQYWNISENFVAIHSCARKMIWCLANTNSSTDFTDSSTQLNSRYQPLYLLYFKVNSNLTRVDGIIGMLMDGITKRGLEHCINVVVVSDHGRKPFVPRII